MDFVDALCDILLEQKKIELSDIKALKKDFAERDEPIFETFLLEENIINKEALLYALKEYYKVPAIDVVGYFFEHNLVKMFPKDVMLRNCFIPLAHDEDDEDVLVVVAGRPDNEQLLPIIGQYVSYDIVFDVGIWSDIIDSVEEFFDEPVTDVSHEELSIDEENLEEHDAEDLLEQPKEK